MIKNVALSLFQTLFSIFALFFSYRFIVEQLGVEQLGLWALFISIVSLSRIAELGLSGSIVKYVSSSLANNDIEKVCSIIETVTLSVAVLVSALAVVSFSPTLWLVTDILDGKVTQNTENILAFAFVSTCLASMAGVNKGALDGCQRYDLSTIAVITSTVIFITSIITLVPRYGINGLAYSYILQGASLLVMTRLLLKRAVKNLPLIPYKFSYSTFKEIRSYGLKFQLISICTLFLDPLTKGMIGKFGDIGMVGYFELANKFITQMRSLLVAMNQVLIPKVSENKAKGLLNISHIYKKNYQLLSFTTVYFFTALLCIVPIIEILWLKEKSAIFELFSLVIAGAYFINTLTIPAYMINAGTGDLRNNVISHVLMSLTNLVMGYILGSYFGGKGAVFSAGIALVAGSIPTILPFHRRNKIPLTVLMPKTLILGLVFGSIGIMISWYLNYNLLINNITFYLTDIIGTDIVIGKSGVVFGYTFIIIFIFILIPMWKNPTRKVITNLVLGMVKSKISD